MNDTRALLSRIAEFRQRLDAMPRLVPAPNPPAEQAPPPPEPETGAAEAGSRTQALLEYSLRQLAGTAEAGPPALAGPARRLLADAHGLVTRLKALTDEPLMAGPPPGADGVVPAADPLAVHYRETAALTGAAVRYATTFPESLGEQMRLCEGLEGILDAAHRRFDLLAGALELRRREAGRIDVLARFLASLAHGESPLDPAPLIGLADAILAEDPGRPLRLLYAAPIEAQAYLGSPEYPPPARFVAAHALNCACVLARVVSQDPDWRADARDLVLAALLHDVGMLRVDPAVLAQSGPLDDGQRAAMAAHARLGAGLILARLPDLSRLAEAAATHHERADGSGYPARLGSEQLSPMARLVAAVDVYAALCAPRPHRPAQDPRAALIDVLLLGERGWLDRYATDRLLALGAYPAGTVVELADGSTAVVLGGRDPRTATHAAARPQVALLADPTGRPLATPRFVDLAGANHGPVVRTLDPRERLERLGRAYPDWV